MQHFRTINPEQIAAAVRTIAQVLGGVLVTKGVIGADDWALYSGAAAIVIPTVWGLIARSDANLIASAADVPAVEKIVAPGATPAGRDGHPKVTAR